MPAAPTAILALLAAVALLIGACGDAFEQGDGTGKVTIGEGARADPDGVRESEGEGDRGGGERAATDLPGECPNEGAKPADAGRRQLERSAFCLVNALRAERGLGRLSRSAQLAAGAREHSRDMDRDDYFAHTSPDGTDLVGWVRGTGYLEGRRSYRLAENIAFGTGVKGTPAEIVAGWMASAGHRENILDPKLRMAGMGVVVGAPEPDPPATGAIYTQIFGG